MLLPGSGQSQAISGLQRPGPLSSPASWPLAPAFRDRPFFCKSGLRDLDRPKQPKWPVAANLHSSLGSTRAAHDLGTLHLRGHLRADQRAREAGPGAQVRFPCHGRLARCLTRASPRDSSRKSANGCHAAGSVSRRDVTEHETARDDRPAGKIFWDQMLPERYGLSG